MSVHLQQLEVGPVAEGRLFAVLAIECRVPCLKKIVSSARGDRMGAGGVFPCECAKTQLPKVPLASSSSQLLWS